SGTTSGSASTTSSACPTSRSGTRSSRTSGRAGRGARWRTSVTRASVAGTRSGSPASASASSPLCLPAGDEAHDALDRAEVRVGHLVRVDLEAVGVLDQLHELEEAKRVEDALLAEHRVVAQLVR